MEFTPEWNVCVAERFLDGLVSPVRFLLRPIFFSPVNLRRTPLCFVRLEPFVGVASRLPLRTVDGHLATTSKDGSDQGVLSVCLGNP